jgi:hypothetical protein
MVTVQKNFKPFQSLTMIMYLELGITDGVSVSLVLPGPGGRLPSSQIEPSCDARKTCIFLYCNKQVHRDFLTTLCIYSDTSWWWAVTCPKHVEVIDEINRG